MNNSPVNCNGESSGLESRRGISQPCDITKPLRFMKNDYHDCLSGLLPGLTETTDGNP